MLNLVQHKDAHNGRGQNRRAVTAISAAIGDDFPGNGDQCSIFLDAGFNFIDHAVFTPGSQEFFFTIAADLDRQSAGLFR